MRIELTEMFSFTF